MSGIETAFNADGAWTPVGFILKNNTIWSITLFYNTSYSVLMKSNESCLFPRSIITLLKKAAPTSPTSPYSIQFQVSEALYNNQTLQLLLSVNVTTDADSVNTLNFTNVETNDPTAFTVTGPVQVVGQPSGTVQYTLVNENSSKTLRPLKISSHLLDDATLQKCYIGTTGGGFYKLQPDNVTYILFTDTINSSDTYAVSTSNPCTFIYYETGSDKVQCQYTTANFSSMEIDSVFKATVNKNYYSRLQWEFDTASKSFTLSLNPRTISNDTGVPLYVQFPAIKQESQPIQVSLAVGTSAIFAAADLAALKISFVK
jgi:hypothetical protein